MSRRRWPALAALWLLPACAAPCASAGDILSSSMTPAALGAIDTAQPRRLDNGARLDWVPCWFEPGLGDEAHCAHFFPSRDGKTASGPAVRLPVVVLKSVMPDTRPSPVLYLPPGPGSPAGLDQHGLEIWSHWQGLARWPHDLVLFDVRGAGLSQPGLHCPEIVSTDRAGLKKPLTAEDDLRALQASARQCYRRLRARGIDPAAFSTARQVRDIGELMALLGGQDWNLWGVSYGTRLALHAVREFPHRIRSVTLDSVYPPEVNGLLAKPGQFARVAGTLAGICAQDPQCAAAHPALPQQIAELMARVAAKPVHLQVEKWPGVWRHRFAVNDYRLLWMLFLESYRPSYRARYPRAIAAALAGDYEPLQPLAENFIDTLLDPDFSHGLYYATLCPEDLPGVSREAYRAEAQRHPAVARHVLSEWDLHVCHTWDAGRLPEPYFRPVSSEVPALFLSGAHDTVTLPGWARDAAKNFPKGRHYTFAGSSHAVTWENDCAMGAVFEFLADPRHGPPPACRADLVTTARP